MLRVHKNIQESLNEHWWEDEDPMNWSDKHGPTFLIYNNKEPIGYIDWPYEGYDVYPEAERIYKVARYLFKLSEDADITYRDDWGGTIDPNLPCFNVDEAEEADKALNEALEDEVVTKEVELEDEIPSEESEFTLPTNLVTNTVNNLITEAWNFISDLNQVITTIDTENIEGITEESEDSIKDILNSIIDDTTVNIGMLSKVSNLLDVKTAELMDKGIEKAENISKDSSNEEDEEIDSIEKE